MDQITVVGRLSLTHELLTSLQSLGVVQIDPVTPEDGLDLKKYALSDDDRRKRDAWEAAVARAESLIAALEIEGVAAASKTDVPSDIGQLQAQLETIGREVDKLVAERAELRDEQEIILSYLPLYRDIAPTLAQLEDSHYLAGTALSTPLDRAEAVQSALANALGGNIVFGNRARGKEMLMIAAVMKRDLATLKSAISREGYAEITLPERYRNLGIAKAVHLMEERSQSLPDKLSAVQAALAKLAEQHGAKLKTMLHIAQNQQARYQKFDDLAAGRYGFALQGWVPSSESKKVADSLKKQFGDDIVIDMRQADEHHDVNVPVKLDNPSWIKPFEGLLSLFAPPKYGNFDPSWTLAVFFPLFFGIVVGDIGFGLLFALLALWMRRRGRKGKDLGLGPLGITIKAPALGPIAAVILWCAGWSMVFGFIYGEFFGNFLEHWPAGRPVFYVPGHAEHGGPTHAELPLRLDHLIASTTPLAIAEAPPMNSGVQSLYRVPGLADAANDAVSSEEPTAPAELEVTPEAAPSIAPEVEAPTDAAPAAAAHDEAGHDAAGSAAHHDEAQGHAQGLIPILLFRVERFGPLLLLSLGFGILQVLGGWGIRVYYGFKHHDMKHVYEGVGMIGGLLGLIVFAWGYVSGNVSPLVTAVLIAGLAVFLVGMVLSRVFLMLIELASNAGNILSYLRLFAVGLSAALVANLATDLGFAISGALPVVGPLLGIAVALSVHLIAIALTIIGHTLQPLRLNYVEFFTKFGFYDESGRPYQPFRLIGGK
jgi:vacuolar-type H+-ATPase subunit I/STV1